MTLSRKRLAPLVAELFGTFILTMTILSVSQSQIGLPYFVAFGAGLAMIMLVFMIGSASGAHVNPAVTFGLWSGRKIGTLKALLYIAVQFMGAAFAWKLYTYLIDGNVTSIASAHWNWRIFTAEAFGAAIFTFGIAAAIYQKYEGAKLAVAIGGSLALGVIVASAVANNAGASAAGGAIPGGIINPAVALGVQAWSKEYVLGPLLGGLVGVNLFALMFAGQSLMMKQGRSSFPSKITFSSKQSKPAITKTTTKSKKTTKKRR